MIPVLLVLGFVCGRWLVIAVAAIGWPLILFIDGSCDVTCAPAAAVFAAANAAVGVVAHKAAAWPVATGIRAWRRRRRARQPA